MAFNPKTEVSFPGPRPTPVCHEFEMAGYGSSHSVTAPYAGPGGYTPLTMVRPEQISSAFARGNCRADGSYTRLLPADELRITLQMNRTILDSTSVVEGSATPKQPRFIFPSLFGSDRRRLPKTSPLNGSNGPTDIKNSRKGRSMESRLLNRGKKTGHSMALLSPVVSFATLCVERRYIAASGFMKALVLLHKLAANTSMR
ncbi:hypothetical protein SBOR_4919 [Sclerotinia borealis F-4128]|uniref:Uncharacterized protein n=1 Tax=Sclerotinia borealis (strain F-4128) TaxID=1432307 RepID=W9CFI3_SCLBF|nr:hypothetical protein SBOR_4919 [Sclerotinia borealis F-4128]